jgi:hypothetical protein
MVTAFFGKNAPNKPRKSVVCGILALPKATLLIMAHGDDTLPCAWQAAKTALEAVAQAAQQTPDAPLRQLAHAAHISVTNIFGICKGAKARLSMAHVDEQGNYQIYHEGEGAIFGYDPDTHLEELATKVFNIEFAQTSGKLNEQHGLLLVNEGLLQHPKHGFLAQAPHWFQHSNPQQHTQALLQQFGDGQQDDMAAVMLKF